MDIRALDGGGVSANVPDELRAGVGLDHVFVNPLRRFSGHKSG